MKKSFLNILLVSSFLYLPTSASDLEESLNLHLTSQLPLVQSALPSKSLSAEVYDNFKQYASDFAQSTKKRIKIAKEAYTKRDVGTAILELFEAHMQAGSKEFLKTYFKPKINSDEFDLEALLPLVEKIQNTLYGFVDGALNKKPFYVQVEGKKLSLMEDKTVVRKLLETLIPNAVPLKGLAISVVDIPVIRSYLVRKTNEATIYYLMQFYQKLTGSTAKNDINKLINQLVQGAPVNNTSSVSQTTPTFLTPSTSITTTQPLQEEDVVIPSQEMDSVFTPLEVQEVEENSSELWKYLEPRITRLIRTSFTHIMLPIFEKSFKEFTLELNHQLVPNSSIGSGMLSGGTMGIMLTSLVTGWNPFAAIIGAPLGVSVYLTGNFGVKSLAKTFLDRIEKHKNLYVNYYLNKALPEKKEEHLLYSLNPNPTKLEREIFAADYYYQQIQKEQSLLRNAFSNLSQISGVSSLIQKYIGTPSPSSPSFPSFLVANKEYAAYIWGHLISKKKMGTPLTEQETLLIENLQRYPSFRMKQAEIEIVKQWKEKQAFPEYLVEQKERFLKAEKELIAVYELYAHEIPACIAAAYQNLIDFNLDDRFSLSFYEVEDLIRENIETHLKTFPSKDLDVLKRAYEDYTFLAPFLKEYLTKNVVTKSGSAAVKSAVKEVFQDKKFLQDLLKEYVTYFHKKYQTSHKGELKLLEDSLLGMDLSPIELIELHARMTEEEKQKHLSLNMQEAGQASEKELGLIKTAVETVVEENTAAIADHYASQLMQQFDLKDFIDSNLSKDTQLLSLISASTKQEKLKKKTIASTLAESLRNRLIRTPLGVDFATKLDNFKGGAESQLRKKVSEVIVTKYFYNYLLKNFSMLEKFLPTSQQEQGESPSVNPDALTTTAPVQKEDTSIRNIEDEFEMLDHTDIEGFQEEKGNKSDEGANNSTTKAPIPEEKAEVIPVKKAWEDKGLSLKRFEDSLKINVYQANQDTLEKVYLVYILNGLYKQGKIKDFMLLSPDELNLVQQQVHAFNHQDVMELSAKDFIENGTNLYYILMKHFALGNTNLFYSYGETFDKLVEEKNTLINKIMERKIQQN